MKSLKIVLKLYFREKADEIMLKNTRLLRIQQATFSG
jgi:hypothetical protein